jgi:hypothetical protein
MLKENFCMKTHLHLILVICLVTIAGTSPSFALSYRLTDLGVLPCYNYPNEIKFLSCEQQRPL